jgi:hypothetical protein
MPRIATEEKIVFPRMFLMGDFGCGKTYFLGLLHKKLKAAGSKGLYLCDFDKGYPTLTTGGFDVAFDLYVDRNAKDPSAWERFVEKIGEFEEKGNMGYGGIAVDSLTSLHTALMNYAISINYIKGRRYTMGFGMSTQNDFGVLVNVMTQMFPQFITLSDLLIFIMTAHVKERQNPITQEVELMPAVAGRSLPSQIGDWFNEVWYMFNDGSLMSPDRVVQTAQGNKINCKTQCGLEPIMKLDEALDALIEKLMFL